METRETTLVSALAASLLSGEVRVVDLTRPLSERTPTLVLPPPFANTPGWRSHELSRYDDRGPAWYWNWFEGGEHVGTHLDAPRHWVTGKEKEDVSEIPPRNFFGPAVVIDKRREAEEDPDHLLSIDEVRAWEREHGRLPAGGWLLYRTGWDERATDASAYVNADEDGSHTPGLAVECARWLAEESPIIGIGTETITTDAGLAHTFEPPFPVHHFMHGAGKYGVPQLANLAQLPPTGAVFVAAPLKLVDGSGSPVRALALVPG